MVDEKNFEDSLKCGAEIRILQDGPGAVSSPGFIFNLIYHLVI
jgi:hypothetical protein